jgi:glycosyltransferase involved in cell wall biosynthesis
MTGDTVGGVWTFTLELAQALGKHDIEVVLAAMGGLPSEAQVSEAKRIPNLRLYTSDLKHEWMDDPWSDVEESCHWLLDLERSVSPDLIHLNTYVHSALPWLAPVVLTAHSCVLSWWTAVKGEPAPSTWNRYRAAVVRGLQAASLVTAPAHAMLTALEQCYCKLPHARVIYNGCEPSRFRRGTQKDQIILCAGRLWDAGKNVAALARIACDLPWKVYVAGETLGAKVPGCRALGSLSREALPDWYTRAAIYALPARYEPFGLSALEAGLSGCALVLGDIPSLREIWGGAAAFVPPDDIGMLRKVLRALIEDEPLRASLAEWSYERARQFTAERMAQEYLAIYQEIAGQERALCA